MKTNLTPLVVTSLVVLLAGSILVLAQYPDCVTMGRQPGTNGAAWNRGAIVTVVINPDDFPTSTEREAIQRAFIAWQNANTNSGVTFTFTTGSSPAGAMNTFYIRRDTTETGGYTNIANTGSPTSEGNITTSAVTVIDSRITRSSAITNIMLHEIGHTFGLDHCPECAEGSSVMTAWRIDCFCPTNPCDAEVPLNGIRFGCPPLQGPRPCDETAVNQYANYPATTPTPTPTPTPCAEQGQSCAFNSDCCPGNVCGELTFTCFPCEPDGNNPQGGPCMSEACAYCYGPMEGTYCDPSSNNCWTPILIDVDGDGLRMTAVDDGVAFDGFGQGIRITTAWTEANSDDAWLVLDRNGNGTVDDGTELFSSASPQPTLPPPELRHGFNALVQYDKPANGGNADGVLDRADFIFSSLQIVAGS